MRTLSLVAAGLLAMTALPAGAADLGARGGSGRAERLEEAERPSEFEDDKIFNRYYGSHPPVEEDGPDEFEDGGIFTRLVPPGVNREEAVACNNKRVLRQIVDRFAWAENETWHRGFVIARIEEPRLRYTIGPRDLGTIPHRHCVARAVMTNGRAYTLYYTTEEEMGFASIGDGVNFCIDGLDPWRVHDGFCRTVR